MQVGIGYSELPNSTAAGQQAALQAIEKAGCDTPCDMVLLFSTARHNQQILRSAVAHVVGEDVPIYGGGTVGVITNDTFGYAGDQVGVACLWLQGAGCQVLAEGGLPEGEEIVGERLGKKLAAAGVKQDSPVMLFYDAVDLSSGDLRLLMATWLLQGLEKGLGFLPNLAGAGVQGDHICTPTSQYLGHTMGEHYAMAMAFSDDIQMDTAIMHGCRPASQYYTVTKAEGPVILEINGKPAISFMEELIGPDITPEQYPFFLLFGINHGPRWGEYDENNYASRLCLDIDKERGGIVMFEPDMVEGTEFQLMFRSLDLEYMKPKIEELFNRMDDREPVFAMYIDCAGRCAGYGGMDIEDALVLQQTVNKRVPLLGLYTGVEIATMGGRPRGLDWTGVFCLFSCSKKGSKAKPRKLGPTWETAQATPKEEGVPLEAIAKLSEQNAAKVLALDTQLISIRHELEQKRRGFALLAELAVTLRQQPDEEGAFVATAQRINAALNMQKTIILAPCGQGKYKARVFGGYTPEESAALAALPIDVPEELLNPETPVLVTAADDATRFAALRETLKLPYFISAPVMIKDEVAAILLTGRMVEQTPFLSRLSRSDLETVQAISEVLASVLVRQRLDAAEERAHIMLDATPLCANFWDKDYNNIDCNLAAVKLFELSDKQEYLDRFSELSPEFQPNGRRSTEMAAENIQTAFREGRCVFEWMHQKLDGEQIPSEITLVRVLYKEGDVVIGYTRDLRELKATMAEIERTQEELREAKNRAEESSRAKSNFLANMSHEIRTPMNAIIGMTEIAKNADDPERVQYCLGKIDDASNHLLGIINDILDMSKIDAGKFTLSPSEFMMEDMLQRVTNVINFKVDEKNQNFNIKVDSDVPQAIVADRQRLTQVITNLLSNAVKFTGEDGEINLFVHKDSEDQEGNCTLRFEVKDTGIGITQEQQNKLFRSFVQADGSISRRFGGTGLGLAISKDIVEMMNGSIWVESQPKEGSNFQFSVQVQKAKRKRFTKLAPSVAAQKLRILVVDDAPEVLEYFKDIARSIDVECATASSGFEAYRMLEEKPDYDMIFVDWKMPQMDGIAFTRKIREKYGNHVVVVMISAVAWAQIEEEATAVGVNRFISKPLFPSLIVDCINECIGGYTKKGAGPSTDTQEEIFAGKQILLAEDIEINREILSALLADTGVAIDNAHNGVQACEIFAQNPDKYDLILMDIHMPEMDGYQATRKIRGMDFEQAKKVPIVAMTANVFKEDIENCLAAGMNDHVGKPLDIDEVIAKLKKYL